ncbi:trehalase family glycosidase [Gloeocapsa sp. PCC 73106]|uniref:trehalase family glycosidase n=1 Tax=Gloeocapsa sp. PCC 73106 TaxID=102232 RepID=UPI0002ABC8AF|nr:trehalase family glycosidase [Gloeocapsa sp. PCC 73106]ELR98551.1 neutral trehalase [Gloeocapsa sp. PCC 73106]
MLNSEAIQALRAYIKATWKTLTRTPAQILQAAQDPKLEQIPGHPWLVYVSPQEDLEAIKQYIAAILTPTEFSQIELRTLPSDIGEIEEHGLLYLPLDYVVPGGRFNEMYGWDSYFIVLGLLRDQEYTLAQNMADLFSYQIKNYGTILNGNRTYLLNRSHPPLFSRTLLRVFEYNSDINWLKSQLPTVEAYYFYWTVPPHLNQVTGLSHYNALGHGPAPEVVNSEKDEQGLTHYERVLDYYRHHEVEEYDLSLYYDREQDQLTDLFYQGDRSMRESGFDISNRFGPFSVDIIHYAPVCLNVLLYQMEKDIALMHQIAEHEDIAQSWLATAQRRHELIDQFLWDEERGMYFDYNFRSDKRSTYEFMTTFMPLWAGIASPKQAQGLMENLRRFEANGGLLTSNYVSGNQWDAPFGWAPLQLFVVEGLLNYGYREEAFRIASKFIGLVIQEFEKTGTILEKYDVARCSSEVSESIYYGYSSNEIGFGWTNGVILELLALFEFC